MLVTGAGNTLSTFPSFIAYFVLGAVLIALFVALYISLTPYREMALIRAGNRAAATTLSGSIIGFVLPLASVIAHSASLVDVVVWGVVALMVQLGGFVAARMLLPGLPRAIEEGNVAYAIFVAGLALALGILDAACMAG
jgi:putative membrane protein